jgi:triosephosphate isomerase
MHSDQLRPFVGVSMKMHLDHASTLRWLTEAARVVCGSPGIDIAVLPSATAIESASKILAGSPIAVGAQDCFWEAAGAYTGEISPAVLKELGCDYLEVGHAERRAIFNEQDATVARKAVAGLVHGLTPILCVGETDRCAVERAGEWCVAQLEPVVGAVRDQGEAALVVAYEPVWAIGAARPAAPAHINGVVAIMRSRLADLGLPARIIYGGSAGPGLFGQLHGVDGLFLGRSALDPARFACTLDEVREATTCGHFRTSAPFAS